MNIKTIAKIGLLSILIIGLALSLSACKNGATKQNEQQAVSQNAEQYVLNDKVSSSTNENVQKTYKKITQDQAKELMDSESDYVIVDVRTQQEYDEGHIKNAILIPDYEIKLNASEVLQDKDQLILVYCRSGRRSKLASQELANQGYTNVKEFGGINTWQFGTVK